MDNYDEFSAVNKSSMASSIKSSLLLIIGLAVFIFLVFVLVNKVSSWSQNFDRINKDPYVLPVE